MKLNKVFLTLVLVVFMSCLLSAQATNAQINGKVVVEDGSAVPGVKVTATNPKMVGERVAVTDENGKFRLLGLRPGTFTIKFELEGFQTIIRENVNIGLEQIIALNVTMSLSKIDKVITITGQAPLIDVKSTASQMSLTKELIETLPRGRNFDSLVATMPSVHNERMLAGISVDGASGSENQFYIDGMDITHQTYGTKAQNAAFEFVDEVQVKTSGYAAEFGGAMGGVINVITRSGGNEFHGELLGYYSGSVLDGKERDTLELNPLDINQALYTNYQDKYGKDKINRLEGGLNLGGYIIKDKLWFFGVFLPVSRTIERHVDWVSGDPSSDHKQTETWMNFQGKLTAQPTKNLRVSASFLNNFYKYRGSLPNRKGTGDSTVPYADYGFDYPNWTATGSLDYVFGKNLMVTLRGGYFHTDQGNQQFEETTPQYRWLKEAPGYQNTSTDAFDGTPLEIPAAYKRPVYFTNHDRPWMINKFVRDRASMNLDINYYFSAGGEHSIKAGVQWVYLEQDLDNTVSLPLIYLGWDKEFTYGSLYQHIRGDYGFYAVRGNDETGPFGYYTNPNSTRWAIYLQDSWTIGYKFTVNIGIRAEKENIPSFADPIEFPEYAEPPVTFDFADKLAPRIGFVYDVFGDSSLKVYGSWGLFFDVMKLDMAVGSYGGFKWKSAYYTLDSYKWDEIGINGNYPGTHITTLNWREPSFDSTDPDLLPMSQSEIVLGVEKKIIEDVALSVRFVNKHLRYTIEDVGIMTDHGERYYTANPGYGYSRLVSDGGKLKDGFMPTPKAQREYFAVNASLEKKFSNNWWGGFSYTWSSLKGNYSGLASSDEYGRNSPNVERYFDVWWLAYTKDLSEDIGNLPTDRTHAFKFYGSYVFPFGLTVGATANAMSGTPVSEEWQVWVEGYHPFGRGSLGRTPFLFWADLYAEYALKIGGTKKLVFSINVENVFDTKTAQRIFAMPSEDNIPLSDAQLIANNWNYGDYTLLPDPRFKMKSHFFAPMSARIGVKFVF